MCQINGYEIKADASGSFNDDLTGMMVASDRWEKKFLD